MIRWSCHTDRVPLLRSSGSRTGALGAGASSLTVKNGGGKAVRPLPNEEVVRSSLAIDGHLVCAIDHHRRLRTDQPPDHVWIFRCGESWPTLTLHRSEQWDSNSTVPSSASAEAAVQQHPALASLESVIVERYGQAAWEAVLESGHLVEPVLFGRWALRQIERDLEAATFRRPDLVGVDDPDLGDEIASHLRQVGFEAIDVCRAPSADRGGRIPVLAEVTARRLGHHVAATVRIDAVGEVYTRLDRATPIGDDDD